MHTVYIADIVCIADAVCVADTEDTADTGARSVDNTCIRNSVGNTPPTAFDHNTSCAVAFAAAAVIAVVCNAPSIALPCTVGIEAPDCALFAFESFHFAFFPLQVKLCIVCMRIYCGKPPQARGSMIFSRSLTSSIGSPKTLQRISKKQRL